MDIIYYIFYYLFYKFSGAHNKPESDSKYTDMIYFHGPLYFSDVSPFSIINEKKYGIICIKTQPI